LTLTALTSSATTSCWPTRTPTWPPCAASARFAGEAPQRGDGHGYAESLAVYNDAERFSSCTSVTGPFAPFPVPLEGDDISGLIAEHRDQLPMSDQLPTMDPPAHTQHRAC